MRWFTYGITLGIGAILGALWEDWRPFGTHWLQDSNLHLVQELATVHTIRPGR